MHQHRIELDLGNLPAALRGELRELRNQLRQRRNIGLPRPPEAVEQGRAFTASRSINVRGYVFPDAQLRI
jgi:hypothetical protein